MSDRSHDAAPGPEGGPDAPDRAVIELERQVERGSFFTHTALGRNAARVAEVESFVYGLVDVLFDKGVLTPDDVGGAVEKVRRESAARGEVPGPGVALRADPQGDETPPVRVNCAERMPICKAICCKLDFALTGPEVESGKVKWDLGRPYFIRHGADGFCCHNDRETGHCCVYADRPGICRTYSCSNDTRIWKDFEKMELNTEWLEANLSRPSGTRLLAAQMVSAPDPGDPDEAEDPGGAAAGRDERCR